MEKTIKNINQLISKFAFCEYLNSNEENTEIAYDVRKGIIELYFPKNQDFVSLIFTTENSVFEYHDDKKTSLYTRFYYDYLLICKLDDINEKIEKAVIGFESNESNEIELSKYIETLSKKLELYLEKYKPITTNKEVNKKIKLTQSTINRLILKEVK